MSQKLSDMGVAFLVAPYESDAQLAFLCNSMRLDAVISEDSDLMVFYRCEVMLTKIDYDSGKTEETGFGALAKGLHRTDFAGLIELGTIGLYQNLVDVCILAGCDYLSSLPGIGLLTACKLMIKHHRVLKVVSLTRVSPFMK